MAKRELNKMTLEELDAYNIELDAEIQTIRDEKRAVTDLYNERYAEREAERVLDRMSEPEKVALAQAMGLKGIPSEEAVGTPS